MVFGPSCAGASTSVFYSQESREGSSSGSRLVAACAQKVSEAQLLGLGLGFLWASGPFLLAHSSFSVLPVFFAGRTRMGGPASPAYAG